MVNSGLVQCNLKSCHQVANLLLAEFSQIAGKTLLLVHKIVEILRAEPRIFTEYLLMEYLQGIREKYR